MSMQTVEIDSASEGMVLAHDLCDAGGTVLLPQGASLTAVTLKSLRRRGIEALDVLVDEDAPDEAALQAERERRCARLQHLFRRSADSGATPVLLERLLAFRAGGGA